jgi:hypothetical protein
MEIVLYHPLLHFQTLLFPFPTPPIFGQRRVEDGEGGRVGEGLEGEGGGEEHMKKYKRR